MDVEPLPDTVDLHTTPDGAAPVRSESAAVDSSSLCGRVLAQRFAILKLLGSGGMGHAFKALDWQRRDLPERDRHVAIKVLRQGADPGPKRFADLRREFYCAQRLSHPNIVKVFELGQDGDLAFFTMELLEGELLSTRIKRTRPQPPPRPFAWSLIRDIGSGVAHAHSRQVVHGDLKPQNIMITRDGEVRILDFGASGSVGQMQADGPAVLERDRIPAVTPAYTCCELLDGQRADPRDDLFALACLSYELLSGQHPFQGRSSIEARRQAMVPPRPPGLTQKQWRTLQQGLSWHREQRSVSVSDWLSNLGLTAIAIQAPLSAAALRAAAKWRMPFNVRQASLAVLLLTGCGAIVMNLINARRAAVPLGAPAAVAVTAVRLPVGVNDDGVAATVPPVLAARTARRPVKIWAESFAVLPGERFAQVTVARSSLDAKTRFTWWTEGSTAKPGSDFVAQPPTTQLFSPGRRSTTVFVRLLPNQSRKNGGVFYVAIGKADRGAGFTTLARTPIKVPPQPGTMVAAN